MKYVTHKPTGKKYCLDCQDFECICLPEPEYSSLQIIKQTNHPKTLETEFLFYTQKLKNNRVIKAGTTLKVKLDDWKLGNYNDRKTIYLSNRIINKSFY